MKTKLWTGGTFKMLSPYIVIISLLASYSVVMGQDFIKIKQATILTAAAGNKLGEIGIEYIDNPPVAGESINPIHISQNDRILVGDSLNQRLQEFDMNGKPIREYLLSKRSGNIESITVFGNRIYALTGPRPVEVSIFELGGSLVDTINLATVGVLDRGSDGVISFKKERLLNGTINKILLDRKGNIFVLGSDLIMIDGSGKVLKRWGPNVFNFFFDVNDNLIISYGPEIEIHDPNYKLKKKSTQDRKGKFVGKEWGSMIWPEHIDASGDLYGFADGKNMYLARYSVTSKLLKLFPIKQDDFIGASWAVASNGDIYYAKTMRNFRVTKVVEIKE